MKFKKEMKQWVVAVGMAVVALIVFKVMFYIITMPVVNVYRDVATHKVLWVVKDGNKISDSVEVKRVMDAGGDFVNCYVGGQD